jgi:hypothetical protein
MVENRRNKSSWGLQLCQVTSQPFYRAGFIIGRLRLGARYAVPHLENTHGSIVAASSNASQLRIPAGNDYSVSTHALTRFMESVPIGTPPSIYVLTLGDVGLRITIQSTRTFARSRFTQVQSSRTSRSALASRLSYFRIRWNCHPHLSWIWLLGKRIG